MRPEARERILLALDATAKALGGSSFQQGIDLARRAFAKLTEIMNTVQTRELMAQSLDHVEISPEFEEILIQTIESGPQFLRWFFKELNQAAEDDLPTLPNRKPAVSGKSQVEMLQFINRLNFEHGVQLEDAKKRAAQRFGCSVRTIERYWREKKTILANGPKYHFQDLLKELQKALEEDIASDLNAPPAIRAAFEHVGNRGAASQTPVAPVR